MVIPAWVFLTAIALVLVVGVITLIALVKLYRQRWHA